MKKSAHSFPVPPNSVYVWRGFKSASLNYDQFTAFLATVFVPACVQLQPPIGLRAYLPSMVPQANKPAAVPDQTALMFWRTPAAHDEAKVALAERIYSNLHGDVYDMTRSTLQEVPKPLDAASGALQPEQPYYLLDGDADWMQGGVHHLVGARRPDLNPNDFLTGAATWAKALRQKPPRGLDAGLMCCGNDYAVAWLHGPAKSKALQSSFETLAHLTQPVLNADAHAISMDAGLWDDWPGLDLSSFPCLNFQFPRSRDAKPKEQKRRGK